MKNFWIICGLASATTLVSTGCGEDNEPDDVVTVDTTTVVDSGSGTVSVMYQIPTPDQMFTLLEETGAKPNANLIEAYGYVDQQLGRRAQAINLGIIVADLMYAGGTGLEDESILNCLGGAMALGEKLGLSEVFGEDVIDRFNANAGNRDSLENMGDDTYFDLYSKLEEEGEGNVLALMITGGFVESLYIATNMVDAFSTDNAIIDRLADQRLTMDNLLKFMEKYEGADEDVASAIQDITPLYELFYEFEEVSMGDTEVERVDGKLVVSGGTKIVMTEEQFNTMKQMVTELRNSYIGLNS